MTIDDIPFADLMSPEALRNRSDILASANRLQAATNGKDVRTDIVEMREILEELVNRPGLERLLAEFAVTHERSELGGVPVDVVRPAEGVEPGNQRRVLLDLHGGGYTWGGRSGALQESVPIAAIGRIEVVAVDYRMAPEHRFPAASEDVAAVYRRLLEDHPAERIGIYGCSAGAVLTAQAVSWFRAHGLPRPGAIALVGAGGLPWLVPASGPDGAPTDPPAYIRNSGPYLEGADTRDPLLSPAFHLDVLRDFPPTLVVSGTHDGLLPDAVHTHAQLVKAGVEADLHVWPGASHCSISQGVVDPGVPETRDAWDVMVRFFDRHLAR